MKIFLDTSGFLAAVVRSDVHHGAAREVLSRLLHRRLQLHTNSYVVLETMALLQARVGLEAALRFERDLRPFLDVLWIDERLHQAASERLAARNRRSLSLVDCSSFVVMERLGIRRVFAFDDDFATEGFEVVDQTEKLTALG